ncbi:MAG: glycosyltransferase, partial [candidate division NC10 bacterium]|nr:glycosyltransferase [candidate division NC10 bacterium]
RGPLAGELQAEGIPVYSLGKRHRGAMGPLLRLAHVLRRERVEILHTHNWSPNFWGRLVGRAVGVPIVITTEHSMVEARRHGARWANRLLAPLADRIVAVSETVARSHQKSEGIPPARFVTLHNAVPVPTLPERAEARRLLALESHERILLCLGRLDQPKGQAHLLKAMPAILQHAPQVRLLLAGDGPLRPTLEGDATGPMWGCSWQRRMPS